MLPKYINILELRLVNIEFYRNIYNHFQETSLVAQMVKHLPTMRETGFDPWVEKILWRRKWQPTPVFLPGKFHGQRSQVGYSPWGHKRVRHDLETKQQQIVHRVVKYLKDNERHKPVQNQITWEDVPVAHPETNFFGPFQSLSQVFLTEVKKYYLSSLSGSRMQIAHWPSLLNQKKNGFQWQCYLPLMR